MHWLLEHETLLFLMGGVMRNRKWLNDSVVLVFTPGDGWGEKQHPADGAADRVTGGYS
jgi:hypothetical protein